MRLFGNIYIIMKKKYLKEFPHVLKQFHPTKNTELDPAKIRKSSNIKIWWICEFNHEWQATVNDRTRGRGCPSCSGRIATKENNLAIERPDLVKEWHTTRNSLTPFDYLSSSGKKVWWMCNKGHEWEAAIYHRNYGRGCPTCKGKYATPDNNLAIMFPAIAKEWHPTKNFAIDPSAVMPMSSKYYWWLCPNKHEYYAKVCERTNNGHSCDKCKSLAEKRPEIAAEWHTTKNGNVTPKDVSVGSQKAVFWQCSKFIDHYWKANVSNRTGSKNSGCPLCRASKSEKMIESILQKLNINYKREFKFDNCRSKRLLPFDFAVFAENKPMKLIEFQGEQHYKEISYWGGKKKLEQVQKNDAIKKKFCSDNKISLLSISCFDKQDMELTIKNFIDP